MSIATLLIIHAVTFIGFIVALVIKFKKIPSSISEFYYLLEERKYNSGWLFTMFLWTMGIMTCFYGNPWLFVAGGFLCFTGAAAQYKDAPTNTVHYIGAAGGYGLACLVINPFLIGGIIAISVLANLYKIKNKTFWVEVVAFLIILLGLTIRYVK